ncbi:MAG TPA: Gfo/Idh/MocA family oxidoreductase [Magnetospirillaceae bacterium]|nr:Gfo/Idh/MocA family oxidoreductase [Magnetospirillaceae bacterium]
MRERKIGIIMNGVTGRMGTNQHLVRSLLAIRKQGGLPTRDGSVIIPEPVLVGRDAGKLKALSAEHGVTAWTTDLDGALSDASNQVYFDSQVTSLRPAAILKAVAAGKAIYTEKPIATTLDGAVSICRAVRSAGVRNGVVQDKLWLPGLRKLKYLVDTGFFGRILSVRGEFGYWVFDGFSQPAQRPSWNYRAEDGGGIILDMFCHWQYVISNLFGAVRSVSALGATHIPKRADERGRPYECTAEDSAYGIFQLDGGVVCQFNSSWDVRVRRDDLLVLQVDGTEGSAVAGLRECRVQGEVMTPKPVWNPDLDSPIDYFSDWALMPARQVYDNAFKAQWEIFLLHLVQDDPFPWNLEAGARGVQLAELALRSWRERRWLDVPGLDI